MKLGARKTKTTTKTKTKTKSVVCEQTEFVVFICSSNTSYKPIIHTLLRLGKFILYVLYRLIIFVSDLFSFLF